MTPYDLNYTTPSITEDIDNTNQNPIRSKNGKYHIPYQESWSHKNRDTRIENPCIEPWKIGDIRWSASSPGLNWIPADGRILSRDQWPELSVLSQVWSHTSVVTPENMKRLPVRNTEIDHSLQLQRGWESNTSATRLFGNGNIMAISADNGTLIAAGQRTDNTIGTDMMSVSQDGQTWIESVSARMVFSSDESRGITCLASGQHTDGSILFVSGGQDGRIASSPDGYVWTHRASAFEKTIHGLTWGLARDIGGLFVAIDKVGDVSTSTDGMAWAPLRPTGLGPTVLWGNTLTWGRLENGKSTFIAGDKNGLIALSGNGKDWTLTYGAITAFESKAVHSITWGRLDDGSSLFVAGGYSGKIVASTNGRTWFTVECGLSWIGALTWIPLPDGSGIFVAGGYDKDVQAQLATSRDGRSWSLVPEFNAVFTSKYVLSLGWGNGLLIVGGRNGAMATAPCPHGPYTPLNIPLRNSKAYSQPWVVPGVARHDPAREFVAPVVWSFGGMRAYVKGK